MKQTENREESLLDYALREMKIRIQNGTYPPGTKLSTQEISESLGISRTPVVSAINRLVAQGLAEAIPRRGTIVSRLNSRQIKDMIDVRRMIEEFSIPLIIKNMDYYENITNEMKQIVDTLSRLNSRQIKDMIDVRRMIEEFSIPLIIKNMDYYENITNEMKQIVDTFIATELNDYTTFANADTKFHQLFVTMTGNQQLIKLYEMNWSVGALFYMYSVAQMPLSRHQKACHHHKEILSALLAKNENALRIAIQEHFDIIYESIEWYEMHTNLTEQQKK